VIAAIRFGFSVACVAVLFSACTPKKPGLHEAVEIIRDSIGINHIYAKNEHDLFYAQGYAAATDRLFQFEMWRRQATGTVAEILGPRELNRDIGARLFRFRGNLDAEFNHYHPRGKEIITAFTEGINARIAEVLANPGELPLEFQLLNLTPGYWTPEVVISRHQGLLGNIDEEVTLGRATALAGADKIKSLLTFEPGEARLHLDTALYREALFDSIIYLYRAFRQPLRFRPEDVARTTSASSVSDAAEQELELAYWVDHPIGDRLIGSNNWIVSGAKSASGQPLLANDPHRALAVPSLRYLVHLHAPGWNVMGAGEPTIPGVSIGHNEHGAWGLTIFTLDGEDLYQYRLHPTKPNHYQKAGQWVPFTEVSDTIAVKGQEPVIVTHRYTHHGPVVFVDTVRLLAYAVRAAWLEPGAAPYLASLRMDQATDWASFQKACTYNRIPGENMIWADRQGNIGWQAAGIAPIRRNWDGLVPVPGDGRYEWVGYLPVDSLPHVFNPAKGYWATANENLAPPGYTHTNAVGYLWATRFRADRIDEVLRGGKALTIVDMQRLQNDYHSLPARELVPLLRGVRINDKKLAFAASTLLDWNFELQPNSVAAGIYVAWERALGRGVWKKQVPLDVQPLIRSVPLNRVIEWLQEPKFVFDGSADKRDAFLLEALAAAVDDLAARLGSDPAQWQYGQEKYHHVRIRHPLSTAVDAATRSQLEIGPLPRGGYGATPGMTSNSDNQSSGASFRMVVNVGDWDATWFTNTPGQSGDPKSPFYKNLFEPWANDRYVRAYFSREKIERAAYEKKVSKP
jgi:penicillin amidase